MDTPAVSRVASPLGLTAHALVSVPGSCDPRTLWVAAQAGCLVLNFLSGCDSMPPPWEGDRRENPNENSVVSSRGSCSAQNHPEAQVVARVTFGKGFQAEGTSYEARLV